ncbi:alpha-1B adrenergic receptor-like [Corticium candelabrum]|uniref:alpha-1B adrenergic receptor-like n=1 Tax=Corticium candelabrum TaxID=121492 RepID=UPI002E25A63A|nr:alpha-1B adrenergic receptor-like [Corticium candelabrum]
MTDSLLMDFVSFPLEENTTLLPNNVSVPNKTNMTGPPSSLYTATVRRAFVIATGIPAGVETILCTLVLYAAFRVKAYHSALNFLVVNAAAADLLRGIHGFFGPPLFYDTLDYTSVNKGLCVCYMWTHIMQYCWSMWSIALIAYSRYDLVANPFRKVVTKKIAIIAVFAILIEGIIFASLPLMGWNSYGLIPLQPGSLKYRCSVADKRLSSGHKAFLPVFYGVNYLLPLIVVVVSYGLIVPIAIRQRRRRLVRVSSSILSGYSNGLEETPTRRKSIQASGWSTSSSSRLRRGSDSVGASDILRSRAFCYVTVIVVSNVVLTTPFAAAELLRLLDIVDVNVLVIPVVKLVFALNFVVNSCFYVLWVRDFRHGLLNTLGCSSFFRRRRWRKNYSNSSKSETNSTGKHGEQRILKSNRHCTTKEVKTLQETSV